MGVLLFVLLCAQFAALEEGPDDGNDREDLFK